jgi:S-adenosylmethionine hydrolase
MPIVTLTSDFGLADYYVAVIKGALLCQNQNLNIIDITHNIKTYDIVQGAFVLKNAFSSFPKETIHILSVNNFYSKKNCFLAVRFEGHYFIGPDNGIFSLLFDENPKDIYELEYDEKSDFPLKDIFSKAVGHITSGLPFNEIGIKVDEIEERISFQPVISKSQIRGAVIQIDRYENVIVNITKDLFEQVSENRKFAIYFKRFDPIKKISNNYSDVAVGERLCFFNSSGYLEIAINMGKASSMLGLNIDDSIQIDFN